MHPTKGFPVKDRRYHLRKYKSCFVGILGLCCEILSVVASEAVEWLLLYKKELICCDSHLTLRHKAILLCRLLLELGISETKN